MLRIEARSIPPSSAPSDSVGRMKISPTSAPPTQTASWVKPEPRTPRIFPVMNSVAVTAPRITSISRDDFSSTIAMAIPWPLMSTDM